MPSNRDIIPMHYYQFNIGDYASHTAHLDEIEDIAYRRMLDYCYLNEIGLPDTVEEIARLIRMRTHCVRIAHVLREFFTQQDDGTWLHSRVEKEIAAYREKSNKAAKAARKRWDNTDANALQTQSEGNANHKPLTNNHKPVTNKNTRAVALDYSSWPEHPSDQVLADWLDMRKRLKANVSQTVINNFAAELNKASMVGYSVDHCLSECVARNWRGFKFNWIQESGHAQGKRSYRETLSERANRAADEAFGTGSRSGVFEGCFDIVDQDGADPFARSGALPDLGGGIIGSN
jgi:uncharacterized protein YdaU (DUF1376 family)